MHGVKIHREGTAVLVPLFGVMVALMVPLWLFMAPGPVPLVLTALMVTGYAFVFNFSVVRAARIPASARIMW